MECGSQLLVYGAIVVLSGTCGCYRQMSPTDYQSAVASGFAVIPQARQMEELFGECNHAITHNPRGPSVWQSNVVIEGRYELAMECKARLSNQLNRVVAMEGAPQFYINEITRVDVEPSGVVAMESQGQHVTFGLDKWQEIVASNGDLSAAGIVFERGRPVPNVGKYVERQRDARAKLRPKLANRTQSE